MEPLRRLAPLRCALAFAGLTALAVFGPSCWPQDLFFFRCTLFCGRYLLNLLSDLLGAFAFLRLLLRCRTPARRMLRLHRLFFFLVAIGAV